MSDRPQKITFANMRDMGVRGILISTRFAGIKARARKTLRIHDVMFEQMRDQS